MSVSDAVPGDIYVDDLGKLWRCMGRCDEPTVIFREVEGHVTSAYQPNFGVVHVVGFMAAPTPIIERCERRGGVNGLMWNGWKRIWRRE